MKNLPTYLLALSLIISALILAERPFAQQGTQATYGLVLTTCGSPPGSYLNGTFQPITMNTAGSLCVNQ